MSSFSPHSFPLLSPTSHSLSPPPSVGSSELPKAPGFAESCIIRQRLSLGRLQAPVTVIPARMQSWAASPGCGLTPCSAGASGTGGLLWDPAHPGVPALHPPPGYGAILHHPQPESTSSGMGHSRPQGLQGGSDGRCLVLTEPLRGFLGFLPPP